MFSAYLLEIIRILESSAETLIASPLLLWHMEIEYFRIAVHLLTTALAQVIRSPRGFPKITLLSTPPLFTATPSTIYRILKMPPKVAKPTSDELLAQFDTLGVENKDNADQESKPTQEPKPTAPSPGQPNQDIFAELDNLASQHPSSRSGTPRLSTEPRSATRSPKPATTATPSTGRSSEDKPASRKSQESGRSSRADNKPGDAQPSDSEKPAAQDAPQGGGWFGGFFATASAAMKQAEAAVKEIQNNEEAQKWAQQMKGNVGALKDLGISITP